MSSKTKSQLRTENNSSFPNNNSQLITPEILRTFNEDIIDSMVSNDDSGSFTVDTGSLLTTASFDNGTRDMTFTKGDGSTFTTNIPGGATDTGSLLVTASAVDSTITFTKGDSSTFDITVDNVVNSTYSQNTITTGKNLEATEIIKGTPLYFTGSGTQGNLVGVYRADAGNPSRMPAGGIAGETLAAGAEGIVLLDGYIGGVDTSLFQSGDLIYVAVGGGYTNQKPTGSTNQIQYLGNVEKSDAIAGSGVINMMGEAHSVPNIQQGYAWVGDSNGVAQPVSTASWDAHSDLTQLNQFTQSQEIYNTGINSYTASNDIRVGDIETYVTQSSQRLDLLEDFTGSQQALNTTFATTGSNEFNGNNNFSGSFFASGSAKLLNGIPGAVSLEQTLQYPSHTKDNKPDSYGTNFIGMLNYSSVGNRYDKALTFWQSDSPAFNYGAIQFNAGYEIGNFLNTVSGSIGTNRIETKPDGNTLLRQYAEEINIGTINNNSIAIGNAGSTNSVTIGAATQVQVGGGSFVMSAPATASGDLQVEGNFTSSLQEGYLWVGDNTGTSITVATSSLGSVGADWNTNLTNIPAGLVSGSDQLTSSYDSRYAQLDGVNFFSGPNNIFTGSVLVSGSGQFVNTIPGAFSFDRAIDYGTVNKNNVGYSYGLGFTGMLNYSGASNRYDNANVLMQADSAAFNYFGITYNAGYEVGNIMQTISGSLATNRLETNGDGTTTFRAYGTSVEIGTLNTNQITIGNAGSVPSVTIGAQTQVSIGGGSVVFNAPATASGDLQVQGNFTSSLQEGYVWVGDASGTTTTVSTGSFGGGGSGFPFTGDAVISGSLQVTGSVRGDVVTLTDVAGTTTVDFEDGNMFVLTLPTSANTVITPTNIKAGQTVNIQITQPATTGSCTFASSVKFAGGYPFTATTTGSAVDMLTMVSYDGTNVLATGIKNFS